MLSDGELDEELELGGHPVCPLQHRLDNLVTIVDYNKIQSLGSVEEVLDLHPLAEKFRAFNWAVKEIDGHDHAAISAALRTLPFESGRPSCLIANTIKGKGVEFMENKLLWHYRAPSAEQVKNALGQPGCTS